MPREPRWITAETVAAINREEVAKTGEAYELKDRAALESAVKRPWNVWAYFLDEDLATLAMSLLVAVAGAKPFAAGNERTAYRAAVALLAANDIAIDLGANATRAEERLFDYFRGRLSQAGVRMWFRTWMKASG